jgi:trigger factor
VEEAEVTQDALDEAMYQLRVSFQELEEVERPAEIGDLVTVTGEGKVKDSDDEVIWSEQDTELLVDPEKTFPDVPFVEKIVGLSAGDENEFNISFPEEYEEEDLADKEAVFNIAVSKVQSRTLPELDDELAQEAGDYQTVSDLREAMEQELLEQAENRTRNELLDEWVEDLLSEAELVYPPAVVESELDRMVEEFKEQITRSGWQWDDFLKLQGETDESLRVNWNEGAVNRIRRGLVLREFARQEILEVESNDIDEMLEERLGQYDDNKELQEQLRSVFTQGQGLDSMSSDILMNKVVERVQEIVTGNAPDLDELDQPEDAAGDEEE